MLEIPVNTCNITYKPVKKRKSRRKKSVAPEEVKQELLQKVNSAAAEDENPAEAVAEIAQAENAYAPVEKEQTAEAEIPRAETKKKRKFAISAVTVELVVIGALLAVIFLTNAFYPQSGINAFMHSVFGEKTVEQTVDERLYGEFAPVVANVGDTVPVIENGTMTVAASGSVYAPCDGKIAALTADGNGKYTLEIAHSENFRSVIMGLDYAYANVGDTVYGNLPVGYVSGEEFKMCFTGEDGAVITDYEISDNTVVWAV